ncbi:MAG: MOSC domain-containing protein [Pirellulaceae bacterium]|nr:MOSC domain-containing protein [Pirellulaceae bacterium]
MNQHRMHGQYRQSGQVTWIGLRPSRGEPIQTVNDVEASTDSGLVGDFFQGPPGAPRQVTLIQAEHLAVVGQLLGHSEPIDPALTRRNLLVSGINLQSLKHKQFRIGTAILKGTGNCAPCKQMEANLGLGGFNAMRGHGGITATVIQSGVIKVGDSVEFFEQELNEKAAIED